MALISVVILGTTGYAWGTFRNLNSGLQGNDVINETLTAPDGATDILLIGNDSRTDAQGNPLPDEVLSKLRASDDGGGDLTDTMILVRIPNGGQRASAVSFPRDTRVEMPENYGTHKLNSAYARAKAEAADNLKQQGLTDQQVIEQRATTRGQKFLIKTIERISGVHIDHYAEVNLLGFYRVTKVIGGVKVCLKNPVDDSEYSGAVFPAGPQVIKGADALAFVRQRHGLPRGDLDRIVRQQVFMSALAKKILSRGTLSNPAKLSELVDALKDSIVLDKDWDILSFAQKMQGIAAGNIKFHTIPLERTGGSGKITIDRQEVQRFVDNLLLPPAERKARQQAAAAAEEKRSRTTVNVYNASDVGGLAGRVLDNLTNEGFDRGVSANADSPMSQSVVRYAPGEQAVAKLAASELGGLATEASDTVESGSVEVYLGSAYSGPGTRNFAGDRTVRLDGMQQSKPRPAQQPHPRQQDQGKQPITAGGVPCVN
ncbi:LCP family protein [Haloactinomyces albus]|uniref:LCP family protein required for cell wall assembly n=1 Tax=Haloactinomyces albus TaxID=1352928 RepID=A0AAE4CKQ3_9ACTN|nr:LCP family protein [Haloactinomyces albus]MDR7301315.1 LCP family protein required for cell wall assembly [Haloactinomyces albus]